MSQDLTLEEKVKIFSSRFQGRTDCFNVDRTDYTAVDQDPTVKVKKDQILKYDNTDGSTVPVGEDDLKRHITGEAPIALFLKSDEDTVKCVCIDFDYPWDYADAAGVQKYIEKNWGIESHLARSSRKGWHLWFFFAEWIDFKYFTSFWSSVQKETEIYQTVESQKTSSDGMFYRPPEVFPRPTSYGQENPLKAGAIKPPMVEPRMRFKFNAWYRKNELSNPVCVKDQWAYLRDEVKPLDPLVLMKALEDRKVPIEAPMATRPKATVHDITKPMPYEGAFRRKGSFKKVIAHCPALRAAYESDGNVGHMARMALGIMATTCEDGVDAMMELTKRSPKHWQEGETKKKLEEIVGRYIPYTCRAMQLNGVCLKGVHPVKGETKDHCLEPRMDGDTPIDPSPYRFAVMSDPDEVSGAILDGHANTLRGILTNLASKKTPANSEDWMRPLANYCLVVTKQLAMAEKLPPSAKHIEILNIESQCVGAKDTGYIDSKMFAKLKQDAKKMAFAEKKKKSQEGSTSILGGQYDEVNNCYVAITVDPKTQMPKQTPISNFILHYTATKKVVKNISHFSALDQKTNALQSNVLVSGQIIDAKKRKIDFDDFQLSDMEDRRLAPLFTMLAKKGDGTQPLYLNSKIDELRNCIKEFNNIRVVEGQVDNVIIVKELGWQGDKGYLVDNMFIGREENASTAFDGETGHKMLRLIKDRHGSYRGITLGGKDCQLTTDRAAWEKVSVKAFHGNSKVPQFAVVSPEEMKKELLPHFINEFMRLHQTNMTYICTGFALAAGIQRRFFHGPIRSNCPTLFLVGLSNKGKSHYTNALQCLYGQYEQCVKWDSTLPSLTDAIPKFKDILFCIDDYKKSTTPDPSKVLKFIQLHYDQGQRGLQTAKNEAKETAPADCLFFSNGEDVFENEFSVASRCIVLDYNKYHLMNTNEKLYENVMKNRQKYSAVTAYLIAYAMTLPETHWEHEYENFMREMKKGLPSEENVDRILKNTAIAFMGASTLLCMSRDWFFLFDKEQFELHMKTLIDACRNAINSTLEKLKEDKPGNQFIRTIKDMIFSQKEKYYIEGIGTPPENAQAIKLGFWRPEEPKNIYLFQSTAESVILERMAKNGKFGVGLKTIGNSLLEEGLIARHNKTEAPYFQVRYWDSDKKRTVRIRCLVLVSEVLFEEPVEPPTEEVEPIDPVKIGRTLFVVDESKTEH